MARKSKKTEITDQFLRIQRVHNAYGVFHCYDAQEEPQLLGSFATRRAAKAAASEYEDGATEVTRIGTQHLLFSVPPLSLPELVAMLPTRREAMKAAAERTESTGVEVRTRSMGFGAGDDD